LEIVRREPLGPGGLDDFRSRQLRARDMLRGDLEGEALERFVEESVLTTTLDKAVNWARSNAIFPLTFGLACCAIEMMSIVAAQHVARAELARTEVVEPAGTERLAADYLQFSAPRRQT
jgi:NADH-quinone oxidoreductase subunit B